MSGSQSSMLYKGSILSKRFARLAFSALFLSRGSRCPLHRSALQTGAQSIVGSGAPPPDVPFNRLPARDPNAIAVDGWLLYPTLRLYSLYSDNLFLSPHKPALCGWIGRDAELGGRLEQRHSYDDTLWQLRSARFSHR